MNWKNLKAPFKALVIVAVCAISIWAVLPIQKTIHLGLDLQGGARLLLQLSPTAEVPHDHAAGSGADARGHRSAHQRSRRRRAVDQQRRQRPHPRRASERQESRRSGARAQTGRGARVQDRAASTSMQKADAALAVLAQPERPAERRRPRRSSTFRRPRTRRAATSSIPARISRPRRPSYDQAGRPDIIFQTKDPARFGKLTTANLQKPLGIFLDHRYLSAPIIQGPIYDSGQITGSFTARADGHAGQRAQRRRAARSASKIIEKETIGPTLGKIDLVQSMRAAALGLGLVLHLHDRRLSSARPARRPRARDLRARDDGDSRPLARDADAAGHRRLRALDRHGRRRQRPDLRAHQRRAVERQDDARRGARRLPARLLGRLR